MGLTKYHAGKLHAGYLARHIVSKTIYLNTAFSFVLKCHGDENSPTCSLKTASIFMNTENLENPDSHKI